MAIRFEDPAEVEAMLGKLNIKQLWALVRSMAFTCGINNPDGSQCLHVSRRKALDCITRGKVIDAMNQANKERDAMRENLDAGIKRMDARANELCDEHVKLKETIAKLEAQKVEATAQNDKVAELENKILELESDIKVKENCIAELTDKFVRPVATA